MKLVSLFDDFLTDTVNLNQTRFTQLESSIEALKIFLRKSDWEPKVLQFSAQGSWAHKTIIKPVENSAFDADLLVYINPVDDWEAKDYIDTLYSIFKDSSLYASKVRRFSHCITIEYAGERNIDIAPCIKERLLADHYEVCNRSANTFERSEPKAYTDWLIEQNRISTKNNLRKVTRLIKYLRDIKTTFTCPSFLLTTLLGKQVRIGDECSDDFSDTAIALKTLIGRLDDWLQSNPYIPEVRNPVLHSEIQSGAWNQAKYSNFRDVINRYRTWVEDAYEETDREESIGKWRRVFGDDFAKSVVIEKAARISAVACESLSAFGSVISDLVEGVRNLGHRALPDGFTRLPHMERPKWRMASDIQLRVKVRAQLATSEHGNTFGAPESLAIHQAHHWIRFHALTANGVPFPSTYSIKWRITNTDRAAELAHSLRGDFYSSNEHGVRWEQLTYRGVHMVEAFVVRKSDDRLVGRSEVFYVVIE